MMEKLHDWLDAQFDERRVEPNSGLGQAIIFLLKHWDRLTLFLRASRERRWTTMSEMPRAAFQMLCRFPDYAA